MGSRTRCTHWATLRGAAAAAPSSDRKAWFCQWLPHETPSGSRDLAPRHVCVCNRGLPTEQSRGRKPWCLSLQTLCISELGPAPGLLLGAYQAFGWRFLPVDVFFSHCNAVSWRWWVWTFSVQLCSLWLVPFFLHFICLFSWVTT